MVPPDPADAVAAYESAEESWNAFPRTARRGILEWIVQAKRPQTRERRVRERARLAESDQRAAQWTPKQRS